MRKASNFLVAYLVAVFLVNISSCIYTPYETYTKKPKLSPGIKTTNWKNTPSQNNILVHHNYSHVNYQNAGNALTPQEIYESTTKKLYPVYRPTDDDRFPKPKNNEVGEEAHQKIVVRVKKQLQVFEKCPPSATGQFVYSLSCNQYLNCWKGRTFVQNCAPGTLFNPDTLTCDFPEKVKCITGPRQTVYEPSPPSLLASSHTVNTRDVQPNCPKQFSGRMPNYSNCSKFIVCMQGEAMSQICPPGTLFDVNRNICDFPKIAKCFNGQNEGSQPIDYFVVDSSNKIEEEINPYLSPNYNNNNNNNYKPMVSDFSRTNYNDNDRNYNDKRVQNPTNGRSNCNNQNDCTRNTTPKGVPQGADCGLPKNYCPPSQPTSSKYPLNRGTSDLSDYQHGGIAQPPIYPGLGNGGFANPSCNPQDTSCRNRNVPKNGPDLVTTTVRTTYSYQNVRPFPSSKPKGVPQGTNCGPYDNSNCFSSKPGGTFDYPQHGNVQETANNKCDSTDTSCRNGDSRPSGSNVRIISRCNPQDSNCGGSGKDGARPQNGEFGRCDPYNSNCLTGNNQGYQRIPSDNPGVVQNQNRNPTGQFVGTKNSPYGVGTSKDQFKLPSGQNNNRPFGKNTKGEPKCPNGVSGLQPHPYDCKKFLNCANGQTFIQNCGPGTMFNPKMMVCDFDYNVDCETKVSDVPDDNTVGGTEKNYNNGDEDGLTTSYTYLTPDINYKKPPTSNGGRYLTRPPKTQNYNVVDPQSGFGTGKPSAQFQDVDQRLDNDFGRQTTKKDNTKWPPPFPATDTNADYVYEYFDVDMEPNIGPQNSAQITTDIFTDCDKEGFDCKAYQKKICIPKNLVCDGKTDCPNTGQDEVGCTQHLEKFDLHKRSRLAIVEKERWDNTTVTSCAYLCLESKKFDCKSFNFRNVDNCCLLSDLNEGLSGRLMAYQPNDYYELKSSKLDCRDMFKCDNNKCIEKNKLCDGQNDCVNREDEMDCQAEEIGYQIGLAGGKNPWEGRVEVSAFGKTGFICDDKFDQRDADVVCKELGYDLGAAEVKGNSFFAQGFPLEKVFYMMDDVICSGNETSIRNCDFNGWGSHDCTNQEVVGVVCKAAQETCPENFWKCKTTNECVPMAFVCDGPEDCSDGTEESEELCKAPVSLRLVNGTNSFEGRIEVKYHGVWGTVCDDDFNDDAAKVVCKNLGLRGTSTVKKDAYFGKGTGPIWLDQVTCFGNETKLDDCGHWNWGEHNCDHGEDVGIICSNSDTSEIERHIKKPTNFDQSTTSLNNEGDGENYPIYPTVCGLRKYNLLSAKNPDVHFRVVQGSKAKVGDYPWQGALRVKGKLHLAHWCGAVVISSKFVLTAAHCLVGYPKGAYVVVAGDYNVQEDEGTEQSAYIEDYYIHEDFRKGHKMNNDIALVKLKGKGFKLNQDVQAICLPDKDTDYEVDLNCTISGFGSIESGTSAFSNELRAGEVPLQRESVCKMPHIYGPSLTEGMICAGTLDSGTDSCDGDSGGPLACLDGGLYTLYGITSWGQRCGYANKPGVFVKVAYYRKWIDDKIRDNI